MLKLTKTKYLIIGAGPGGLQMGHLMEKDKKDYLIIEKAESAGSFYKTQPVHRTLLSINKKHNYFDETEFNQRQDWNSLVCEDQQMQFPNYSDELFPSADDLTRYLEDFAEFYKLNIKYGTEVINIDKNDEGFYITTASDDHYQCEVLLMGVGAVTSLIPEDIDGIELTTPYEEQSVNLELYKNKRVGIIGTGNSAFETANYLSGSAAFVHVLGRSAPRMAWDTHFVGDVRAVNNNIFDMYQLKSLHAVLNPRIKKISRLDNGCLQTHHEYDYPESKVPGTLKLTREYDYIIRCTGWKWVNETMFSESTLPETRVNGKYPVMNEMWESSNVKNMYFIGAAMQGNDRKSSSGFIHGFRYNICSMYHLLNEKHDNVPHPVTEMKPFVWDNFAELLYQRMSTSAALFQLFGTLGDLLVIDKDRVDAKFYKEVPVPYMPHMIPHDQHCLSLTLDFGFHNHQGSSLDFLGPSDPNETEKAAFLHPIIRHHYMGKTEDFHFGDSLLARWDMPHGTGGAVMSYHWDFLHWVRERLDLDIPIPEGTDDGPFQRWTEEEIQAYKDKKQAEMAD